MCAHRAESWVADARAREGFHRIMMLRADADVVAPGLRSFPIPAWSLVVRRVTPDGAVGFAGMMQAQSRPQLYSMVELRRIDQIQGSDLSSAGFAPSSRYAWTVP